MSDVEIAVQAEGVEDAVGEVPPGEAPAGGEEDGLVGGGGGGGEGGGGGKLGRLLAVIGTLLTFAEDILKVIGVVSSVLRAFLAPVAVMLLRLLQPLLRAMINVLPVWFDIMETINTVVENLSPLTKVAALLGTLAGGLAGAKIGALAGSIVGGFLGSVVPGLGTAVGAAVGAKVGAIVGGIVGGITGGVTLAGVVRGIKSTISKPLGGGDAPTTTERAGAASIGGNLAGPVGAIGSVVLQGGLSTFVDRVEQDSGIETP